MKFVISVEVQRGGDAIKGKTMQAIVDFLKREDVGEFDVNYYPKKLTAQPDEMTVAQAKRSKEYINGNAYISAQDLPRYIQSYRRVYGE